MPSTESKNTLRGAVLLALAVTAARLVYVWWFCPYALVEDEAFYWEWSLRPDWSYATKGPGIAWAIWAATHTLGTSEGALRTVAAVSGLIGAVAVGALAEEVWKHAGRDGAGRVGVVACAFFLLAPVFQGTSILCTIDAPYVACWAVAAWAAWRGLMSESRGAWVVLGAALGAGFLFKYTIVLLPPGVLLFAWLARRELKVARGAGGAMALGLLLVVMGLLPVVIWNSQHDWQTVRHLLGKVGMAGSDLEQAGVAPTRPAWTPVWMLEFIGGQIAFVGPAILSIVAGAWSVLARRGGEPREHAGKLFLLCCGAPIVVFYFGLSLIARAEMNWPIAGWTTLLALGGVWCADGTTRPRADASWHSGYSRGVLRAAVIVGVLVAGVTARIDVLQKGVALIAPDLAAKVPVGRLMAGRPMGADADRLKRELAAKTGMEPMVICQQYGRASLLRYYLPGRPIVYCASVQTGGRKVQQDYWADTDLNAPALRGRPAVLVGGDAEGIVWKTAFERVEAVKAALQGDTKKDRPVFYGLGYRGWSTGAH